MDEGWGFIWIMLILKIPLVMLLGIVWWAIRSSPEPVSGEDDDGGIGREPGGPDSRFPRRRGPHGDPVVPAPPRTRVPARARDRAPR